MGDPFITHETVAVYEQETRSGCQLIDGQMHGFKGGLEYIDTVDLFMVDHSNAIGDGRRLDDDAQFVTVGNADLFGIVEQRMKEPLWEDHGSGKYWACITAPPSLVTPGFDEIFLEFFFQQPAFFSKIRPFFINEQAVEDMCKKR